MRKNHQSRIFIFPYFYYAPDQQIQHLFLAGTQGGQPPAFRSYTTYIVRVFMHCNAFP